MHDHFSILGARKHFLVGSRYMRTTVRTWPKPTSNLSPNPDPYPDPKRARSGPETRLRRFRIEREKSSAILNANHDSEVKTRQANHWDKNSLKDPYSFHIVRPTHRRTYGRQHRRQILQMIVTFRCLTFTTDCSVTPISRYRYNIYTSTRAHSRSSCSLLRST